MSDDFSLLAVVALQLLAVVSRLPTGTPVPSSDSVVCFSGSGVSQPLPVVLAAAAAGVLLPQPSSGERRPFTRALLLSFDVVGWGVGDLLAKSDARGVLPPSLLLPLAEETG